MTRFAAIPGRAIPALLLLSAVVACDDGTSPGAELDTRLAAERVTAMVETTESLEDAFLSMQAAGDLFASEEAAALMVRGLSVDVEAAGRFLAAPGVQAFFPSNFLGVTFAFDAEQGRYVATELEGAPADGIRILYYAVDPFMGVPQADVPLGYIDLRDLSSAASDRLAILVVRTAGGAPLTLAEYVVDVRTQVTASSVGATITAEGFLSDGESRLDFDLGQTLTLTETTVRVTQDYGIALAGSGLSVRWVGEVSGTFEDPAGSALDLSVTVRNEGQVAVFELSVAGESLDGRVVSGGTVVAHIGGTTTQPAFTGPDGDALDADELEALRELFDGLALLATLVSRIFPPAF